MTTFSLVVISAGLSQPSSTSLLADRLAQATRRASTTRGERVEVIDIELRELAHDITNNLLTGFPSGTLQSAVDAVRGADAVIAVTPVFAATADFGADDAGRSLSDRVQRAGRELAGMLTPGFGQDPLEEQFDPGRVPTRNLGRAVREPDPFDALVPFEELLAR